MKKKSLGVTIAAALLGGLTGGGQVIQPAAQAGQAQHAQSTEMKGVSQNRRTKERININNTGGLDFKPLTVSDFGMSPKEYGLRFGNGKSRVGKSNRLAYTHKAKLKRRKG